MKLVSIHKLIAFLVFSFFVGNAVSAQQWSLAQCIDSAALHNKNLQIATNNLALDVQKEKEAKAHLMPKLMANADYKYFAQLPYQLMPMSTFNPAAPEGDYKAIQFGVPHNISANLQLAVPLYNPQVYGGIEATKIASELTALAYEKTREQIYFEVSNLYYNAQILHTQLTFLDSNLANANRLLKNLELLNQQLLATRTDVGKVQLQAAQLNMQKVNVSSKYNQVINALKFTIGLSEKADFDIETAIKPEEINEFNAWPSLDFRMTQTQNKLLQSQLKTLNNSRFLPSVNLIGSYGTAGFGYDKEPNSFLDFYPIAFAGIQISYPIFNGTATQLKVNQKQIELSNNELKSKLVANQNTMQTANARLQINATSKAIETSKKQVELAQNIYNNTLLQQKQGVTSLTEVLLADNALREAQQNHLSAIIDYLKADLELKKLTGNL